MKKVIILISLVVFIFSSYTTVFAQDQALKTSTVMVKDKDVKLDKKSCTHECKENCTKENCNGDCNKECKKENCNCTKESCKGNMKNCKHSNETAMKKSCNPANCTPKGKKQCSPTCKH